MYKKGLTQWEIARRLNINQSTVSRYIHKFGIPKNKPSRLNEPRPRRYDKYMYCIHCKWILDKDVINFPNCPKCNKKMRKKRKGRLREYN